MHFRSIKQLLMASGFALMPGLAIAQDACAPFKFVVNHSDFERTILDHGDPGQSVGDQRIAIVPVRNEDGDIIGRIDVMSVVIIVNEDGSSTSHSDVYMHLADGSIAYVVLPSANVRPITDTSAPHRAADSLQPIVTGTGVFTGATGEITDLVHEDDRTVGTVNVSCP